MERIYQSCVKCIPSRHSEATAEYEGGKFYPKSTFVYDMFVYGFNSPVAWGVTYRQLKGLYHKFGSGTSAHVEVGLASPTFLLSSVPTSASVLLVDVDSNWMAQAAVNLVSKGYDEPACLKHDITQPIGEGGAQHLGKYDTIGLNFVLHCVPGTLSIDSKGGKSAKHLKALLRPGGVLYGSTILGDSAGHNYVGRTLMKQFNAPDSGIFSNTADTLDDLKASLSFAFTCVNAVVVGRTAVFVATDDLSRDISMPWL